MQVQSTTTTIKRFSLGTPKLYTAAEVAACLGIGLSTVWLKVTHDRTFPKPFKLSKKQTRWTSESLEDFINLCQEHSQTIH